MIIYQSGRHASKLLTKNHKKGIEITAADVARELMKAQQADNGKCNITFLSKPALWSRGSSSELQVADADSQQQDRPIEAHAVSLFEPKLRLSKPCSPAKPMEAQLAIEAPLTIDAQSKGPEQLSLTTPTKSTLVTAEEFEDAAFKALSGGPKKVKKVCPKTAPKPPICKRPASAAHAVIDKKVLKSGLQLGCKRCRGTTNGCSACRNPNFSGWRGTAQKIYAMGGKKCGEAALVQAFGVLCITLCLHTYQCVCGFLQSQTVIRFMCGYYADIEIANSSLLAFVQQNTVCCSDAIIHHHVCRFQRTAMLLGV